jgi:hypothetical protein
MKKDPYERSFSGRGFLNFDGTGSNGVIVVTDDITDNEAYHGISLHPSSPGGSMFERVIRRIPNVKRDEFKIGSILQCQPPFGKTSLNAINSCSIHRDSLISSIGMSTTKYKQRVILALGPISFRTLTGLDGEYLNLESIRGYPIVTPYGIVIGSYSPSVITQGSQKLMGVLMFDIKKALEIARDGFNKHSTTYIENPTIKDCEDFYQDCLSNPNLPIAFDIETPYVEGKNLPDTIYSIQFSLRPYSGIFFNWIGQEEEIAKKILALPNPKLGFNSWRFDAPMVEKMGSILNGRHDDLIWMFHHFQPDLTTEKQKDETDSISSRMGLQYVASFFDMDFHWKYMKKFKEMSKIYGIADVDALQRIWLTLPSQMRKLNVWEGYEKVRYQLEPVLVNMSKRGIPVDKIKRQDLRDVIIEDKEKNFNLMQTFIPTELRNYLPKGGYKKGWKAVKVKEGKIRVIEA